MLVQRIPTIFYNNSTDFVGGCPTASNRLDRDSLAKTLTYGELVL